MFSSSLGGQLQSHQEKGGGVDTRDIRYRHSADFICKLTCNYESKFVFQIFLLQEALQTFNIICQYGQTVK